MRDGKGVRYKASRTKEVRACGKCVPCLYRRAALHRVNLDTELYGLDVLTGELDIDCGDEHTYDFRDFITFLKESHDLTSIRRLLVVGGVDNFEQLTDYAAMVLRAKGELLDWLNEKARPELLRDWGLS